MINFEGHSIESTIEHGVINSLAAQLAKASGGITRTVDLVEQIFGTLGELRAVFGELNQGSRGAPWEASGLFR